MKVGIICDIFPLYGAKAVAKLVSVLEKLGHSAVILTSSHLQNGENCGTGYEAYGQRSQLVRFSSKYYSPSATPMVLVPGIPLAANHVFEDANVDVVHIHFLASFSFQLYTLISRLKKPFPLVATPHGVISGYRSPLIRLIAEAIIRTSAVGLRSVDHFITITKFEAPFLQSLGVPPSKISYVPNGVDTDTFKPLDRHWSEAKLGLEHTGRMRVLFLAHLRRSKGVDLFLRAIEMLSPENDNIEFLVVGSGPLSRLVQKRSLRRQSRLTYLDYISDDMLPIAYNCADVYVLPSYVEGLPQSLLEAMASGVPAIATDVGGVSELFPMETRDFLLPAGDVAALVGAIRTLARDDVIRTRLSRLQTEHARSHYSLASLGPKNIDVYQKLLGLTEDSR